MSGVATWKWSHRASPAGIDSYQPDLVAELNEYRPIPTLRVGICASSGGAAGARRGLQGARQQVEPCTSATSSSAARTATSRQCTTRSIPGNRSRGRPFLPISIPGSTWRPGAAIVFVVATIRKPDQIARRRNCARRAAGHDARSPGDAQRADQPAAGSHAEHHPPRPTSAVRSNVKRRPSSSTPKSRSRFSRRRSAESPKPT